MHGASDLPQLHTGNRPAETARPTTTGADLLASSPRPPGPPRAPGPSRAAPPDPGPLLPQLVVPDDSPGGGWAGTGAYAPRPSPCS
eukprot:scaffold35363_cov101-Isochrysis_galbana.AAC.3